MKVLVVEDNLLWSERIRRNLETLGHEAQVISRIPTQLPGHWPEADIAIVNLGFRGLNLADVIQACHVKGQRVIAHAGHKEQEKIHNAEQLGCDQVATNGALFHRLGEVLDQQNYLKADVN